jgi:hypothetical protein
MLVSFKRQKDDYTRTVNGTVTGSSGYLMVDKAANPEPVQTG